MPNYEKTILCLANSRKISGRCVAGLEFADGKLGTWLRPVSAREHAELSEDERRFANGIDPKVLDIIRIPMLQPQPVAFQVENHLIDPDYYWTFEGRATWAQARAAVDGPGLPLWANASSSYSGINDRVSEASAIPAEGSLRLIEVQDLDIRVLVEGAEFNNAKRRVRGRFSHLGAPYLLSITDPVVERQYLAQADGDYHVGRALLCVSLGEPWQGWAYKLIAAVISPQ